MGELVELDSKIERMLQKVRRATNFETASLAIVVVYKIKVSQTINHPHHLKWRAVLWQIMLGHPSLGRSQT